jgi:hypothetical protein
MNVLQGWLEFIDGQTGAAQRFDALDQPLPGTQTLLCRPEGHQNFVIRDLSGKNEVLVNSRPVVEAQLTNLDQIQIGERRYLFKAAYLPEPELLIGELDSLSPPKAVTALPSLKPSFRRRIDYSQIKPHLLPCSVAALILLEGLVDHSAPLFIHLAVTTLGTTLAFGPLLILSALSGKEMNVAFKFALQAIIVPLSAQLFFFSCAAHAHLSTSDYFIAAPIPCVVFYFWVARMAGYKLAAAALIPWSLFLTGLMSFML